MQKLEDAVKILKPNLFTFKDIDKTSGALRFDAQKENNPSTYLRLARIYSFENKYSDFCDALKTSSEIYKKTSEKFSGLKEKSYGANILYENREIFFLLFKEDQFIEYWNDKIENTKMLVWEFLDPFNNRTREYLRFEYLRDDKMSFFLPRQEKIKIYDLDIVPKKEFEDKIRIMDDEGTNLKGEHLIGYRTMHKNDLNMGIYMLFDES